eukprot:747567-Hanusia_phi.AAC.2
MTAPPAGGSGTIEHVELRSSNCSTVYVGGGEWRIDGCRVVSDRALGSVISCSGSSRLHVRCLTPVVACDGVRRCASRPSAASTQNYKLARGC